MRIAIIVSQEDKAGMNVKEHLLQTFKKSAKKFDSSVVYEHQDAKLYTCKEPTVYQEHLDGKIKADLFIFATRHSAKEHTQTFSVHAPGNWGEEATLGGKPNILTPCPPNIMRVAYFALKKRLAIWNDAGKLKKYTVTHEVTHHGPVLDTPCFFIEIGSSEEEWIDTDAGEFMAGVLLSLLDLLHAPNEESVRSAIGLGGMHYANNFNRVVESGEVAVGHMCPKYLLSDLDLGMINQAMEKSGAELVLLDWKGLGRDKARLTGLLDDAGIEWKKTQEYTRKNTNNG